MTARATPALLTLLLLLIGCSSAGSRLGEAPAPVPPTPGISGRVCSPSGVAPVVNAYVFAPINDDDQPGEDWRLEAHSAGDGGFLITGAPSGTLNFSVIKGSYQASFQVDYSEGEFLDVGDVCLDGRSANIAVVTGIYDSIGDILTRLGLEHTNYDGEGSTAYLDLLLDPAELAQFDLVFLNCGMDESWTESEFAPQVGANLRAFVQGGGSIYASDWAYRAVEASFPGMVDWYGDDGSESAARIGAGRPITAQVHDESIQLLVGGDEVRVDYDLSLWVVMDAIGPNVRPLITGPAYLEGDTTPLPDRPLAARYDDNGSLVYTTFHNESQISAQMEAILFEIVLSL